MSAIRLAVAVITTTLALVGCGDDDKCNGNTHEPSCAPAADAATTG